MRDLVLGRDNPWADPYSRSRLRLRSLTELARETLDFVPRYGLWLTPGEARSVDDLPPGSGAVLRSGLRKVACYGDEGGAVHARSADHLPRGRGVSELRAPLEANQGEAVRELSRGGIDPHLAIVPGSSARRASRRAGGPARRPGARRP